MANYIKKKFKLCLPKNKKTPAKDEKPKDNSQQVDKISSKKSLPQSDNTSSSSQRLSDSMLDLNLAQQSGTSVKTLVQESGSSDNTQQFADLKRLMDSRFPGDSYQEAVKLKREDFGKIQQSFSEVHRVKKLLKRGESVCKVTIENVQGTGFVLFDNFILTNAHLFKDYVQDGNLQTGINVYALFNYDDPELYTDYKCFSVKNTFIEYSVHLDYAVLELNPEGQKHNQTTETEEIKIPPGLLVEFGPPPLNGETCIIGHPAGGVKKIDPTCIIEKEKRNQAVSDHLEPHRNSPFVLLSIQEMIRNQGIEDILSGGNKADMLTYNTFMYYGSSGSPVFDAHCRVVGLHTAGFSYRDNPPMSVIEFAQPLLTIYERLLTKINERGDEKLLRRIKEAAKGNTYLEKLSDEPMDTK